MASAHSIGVSTSLPRDLIRISEAAKLASVSCQSLRNWASVGLIGCYTLSSGHRRFSRAEVVAYVNGDELGEDSKEEKVVVGYSRCSTQSQRDSLAKQKIRVRDYAKEHYPNCEYIELADLSSGGSFNRKSIKELLRLIVSGRLDNGVILSEWKDRISRINVSCIEVLCEVRNIEIVYIEQAPNKTDSELLFDDVCAILAIYNAKQYSRRGNERQRKPVPLDAIEAGKKLNDRGWALIPITKELQRLGYRNEDGSPISSHAVRKYIQFQDTITRSNNFKQNSTAQQFVEKFVRPASPETRTLTTDVYEAYKRWAKSEGVGYCTKPKFAHSTRKYKQGCLWMGDGYKRAFKAVEFEGVKSYRVKPRQN